MARSERGAVPPMVAAVLAGLIGGATLGWAAQDAGILDLVDEPEPIELRSDRVAVRDCPDGTVVASLARGDRVLAVGRSDDGRWLEIRSPVDLRDGAWVPAPVLSGDLGAVDLARLPVHDCDLGPLPTTTQPPETTTTESTTTSTSSTTTSTTSTTVPETTTTLPVSTIPQSTTTAPNPGPTITGFTVVAPGSLDPAAYVHEAPDVPALPANCASTVEVTFTATDPQGVTQVSLQWTTGPGGATAAPTLVPLPNGQFRATFEFPQTAVPAPSNPRDDAFRKPTFTVAAVDGNGALTTVVIAPPQQDFRVYDADQPCDQGQPDG